MRWAVVVFPGSNCDRDAEQAIRLVTGDPVDLVWHDAEDLSAYDAIVLPGGFSYGDYLRAGAIARFSPAVRAVAREAERGKPVLGICNGFQILTESGLLPGALLANNHLQFRCEIAKLRVETNDSPFTRLYEPGRSSASPSHTARAAITRIRRLCSSFAARTVSRSATSRIRTDRRTTSLGS